MDLFLDRISFPITNLGPGRRIGLWVRGCHRACPGCMAPELFAQPENTRVATEVVAARIISISDGYDGVTISGGEPFDQADAVADVVSSVRESTELDVLVYTGYKIDDLRKGSQEKCRLLSMIDMLMDGPFIEELPGTKLWRGSDNQCMHLLSTRAAKYEEYRDAVYEGPRELHVELVEHNGLRIVGIPERGFLAALPGFARTRGLNID